MKYRLLDTTSELIYEGDMPDFDSPPDVVNHRKARYLFVQEDIDGVIYREETTYDSAL